MIIAKFAIRLLLLVALALFSLHVILPNQQLSSISAESLHTSQQLLTSNFTTSTARSMLWLSPPTESHLINGDMPIGLPSRRRITGFKKRRI